MNQCGSVPRTTKQPPNSVMNSRRFTARCSVLPTERPVAALRDFNLARFGLGQTRPFGDVRSMRSVSLLASIPGIGQTAKALGLEVPDRLLLTADQLIK